MDPGNSEALATINRVDLKLSQKLGELTTSLPSKSPEFLNARLDNLISAVAFFAEKHQQGLASVAEIGETKSPARRQAIFEAPEVSVLCADDEVRKLKLLGYRPRTVYSPSLNAV